MMDTMMIRTQTNAGLLCGISMSTMVRWGQRSAAGMETGRTSHSAMDTMMIRTQTNAGLLCGISMSTMVRWGQRSAAVWRLDAQVKVRWTIGNTYQEENQTKLCYKLDVQYAEYCLLSCLVTV